MDMNLKYDFLIDPQLQSLIFEAERSGASDNYAELAKAYNVRGMFPQALHAAEKATSLESSIFSGWFEYSIAATTSGRRDLRKILEQIERELDSTSDNGYELQTAMALTYYYLGSDDEAARIIKEILTVERNITHSYEVLGYIAYNQDDYKAAYRHFLQALEVDQENFRAHWMCGHCWFELNDLKAAAQSYSRALELQPYFANAWFSLGKIHLVSGNVQKAYQCFHKCLAVNPRIWDCYFTQADYYLGNKMYLDAISACHRILELNPDAMVMGEAENYIGEIYLVLREFEMAEEHFRRAIRVQDGNAVAHNNLGIALVKTDRLDEAMEYFATAMEKDPGFAYPITKLGQAYLEKRDLEKATELFEKALETDPGEYWALLGLSEVYRKQRLYRKQLDTIIKAASICDDDSDVYNYMGIAFQLLKDHENAEKAYINSLELDPYNRKAANNLGFLYERFLESTGDDEFREKAVDAWKRRLLICRDTNYSIKMAVKHLLKLGVEEETIDVWLRDETLLAE